MGLLFWFLLGSLLIFFILRLLSITFSRHSTLELSSPSLTQFNFYTASGNFLSRFTDSDKFVIRALKGAVIPLRSSFVQFKFLEKDGVVTFTFKPWFYQTLLFGDRCSFEFLIPRKLAKNLRLEVDAKSIIIDGDPKIDLASVHVSALKSLRVHNLSAQTFQVLGTSGPVVLRGIRCPGQCDVSTRDGDIRIEVIVADELGLSSAGNGKIELKYLVVRSLVLIGKSAPVSVEQGTCHELSGELAFAPLRIASVQLVMRHCFSQPGATPSKPETPKSIAELQHQLGRLVIRGHDGNVELDGIGGGHIAVGMEGSGNITAKLKAADIKGEYTVSGSQDASVKVTGQIAGTDFSLLSNVKKLRGRSAGGSGAQIVELSSTTGNIHLDFSEAPATTPEPPPAPPGSADEAKKD